MRPCCCGHGRRLHQHDRAGTDCALTGCRCRRYRRHRWWHQHPDVPAAVSGKAGRPPSRPGPPPGLPPHDCGPVTWRMVHHEGGCIVTLDGRNRVVGVKPCATAEDLRQWAQELQS
jgi:hypothetical protein